MSSSKEDLPADDKSDRATARNSQEVSEKAITEEGQVATSNNEAKEVEELEDDEMNYPSGGALALLTLGLCLCTFVVNRIPFLLMYFR